MGSPQFQPGLPLDTAQSSFWNIAFGMHNGDAAGLYGMLELNVTCFLGDFVPIGPESGKDVAAVH
jgi:hypothetical protein